MTTAGSSEWSTPGAASRISRARSRRPWLFASVAIAGVVAVAAVVWVFLLPAVQDRYAGWVPLGGLFLVFIVLWLSFAIVRMAWWSSRREQRAQYRMARRGAAAGVRDPSLQIARQRYARGEISRDEYERLVHDLQLNQRLP